MTYSCFLCVDILPSWQDDITSYTQGLTSAELDLFNDGECQFSNSVAWLTSSYSNLLTYFTLFRIYGGNGTVAVENRSL